MSLTPSFCPPRQPGLTESAPLPEFLLLNEDCRTVAALMAHQSELSAPSCRALQHVQYFSEELKPAFRAETYKLCVVRAAFGTRIAGFFAAKDRGHEPSRD